MTTTTPSSIRTASAASVGIPAPTATRLVTDAPTRMFHALFALSFAVAYATAESEHGRLLHVTSGYAFGGLLVFRLLYGLFGPRQAGLGLLWRRLTGVPAWLRSLLAARSWSAVNGRLGQNLAMAVAIASMLSLVVPLVVSGYVVYNDWADMFGGDWLEEVHEIVGNALLCLALAHVALVVGSSLLRRQNQALPMLTGRMQGRGPDLVQHNRAWLAALIFLAVLALVAWQWWDAPSGLF